MKLFLATFALVLSGIATADIALPPTQTIISGPEATKVAQLMLSGADGRGSYAQGTAEINCVRRARQIDYTCTVKPVRLIKGR